MSNCQPDDLAMVVRCSGHTACVKSLVHRAIVKVKMPLFVENGLWWVLEEPARCPLSSSGCTFKNLPDCDLRPIKGAPGDHPGDVLVKNADDALNPLVYVPPEPVTAP